jgi:hypothetical protein
MSGVVILLAVFVVGTIILAHEMGKDVGREQEFVRQKRGQSYCPECKMMAQPASIYTQQEGSRK